MKVTKKVLVGFIRKKVSSNRKWAVRALVRIASNQTDVELDNNSTIENNGIGFDGLDAPLLTSFFQQFQNVGRFSERQMGIIYKKMPKYSGQLYKLSNVEKLQKTYLKEHNLT